MYEKTGSSIDRRALKILFNTSWSSTGWRDEPSRSITSEDFEYAKRAGVMFDEFRLSHDDTVEQALVAVGPVDRKVVADAFVTSLSSRRLDLRSALGSFAVLQHFPRHQTTSRHERCDVCGTHVNPKKSEDLNVLNFERFKWGGVRHDDPLYARLDLGIFQTLPPTTPTKADVQLLRDLLWAIDDAPAQTTASSLEKHLAKTLRSNKPEREVLIGILGLCDILSTPDHRGFTKEFVPAFAREVPARRFVDMQYPACWWESSDGVNQEAVEYWFGHLL
jgi:hypothetical protein